MNDKMLANPIVQKNINKLKKFGYVVMESAEGELACKTNGKGRLPDVAEIVEEIETLLTSKDFKGKEDFDYGRSHGRTTGSGAIYYKFIIG